MKRIVLLEPMPGFEPGDLFLTNWSSVPGEFELILEANLVCRRDHLTEPT